MTTTSLAVTSKTPARVTLEQPPGEPLRLKVGEHLRDYTLAPPSGLTMESLLVIGPAVWQAREQASQEMQKRGIPWSPPPYTIPALAVSGQAYHCYDNFPDFTHLKILDNETLCAVHASLQGLTWAHRALLLIQINFPEALTGLNLNMFRNWWDLFVFFYRLIEDAGPAGEDWFPLNRGLINWLWEHWQNGDNPHYLARYLVEIPLEVFGIGRQEERDFPVLQILYELLSGRRLRPEVYDSVTGEMLNDVQLLHPEFFGNGPILYNHVCQRADDLRRARPPLDCLVGVARVVMESPDGNPFLGVHFDMDTFSLSRNFYWDRDVARLKDAWAEARPVAEQFRAFTRWFTSDDYDRYWGPLREEQKILEVITLLTRLGG